VHCHRTKTAEEMGHDLRGVGTGPHKKATDALITRYSGAVCVDCHQGFNQEGGAEDGRGRLNRKWYWRHFDLDHDINQPKIKNVSQFSNAADALQEADKCELRCCNCHRRKTMLEGDNGIRRPKKRTR